MLMPGRARLRPVQTRSWRPGPGWGPTPPDPASLSPVAELQLNYTLAVSVALKALLCLPGVPAPAPLAGEPQTAHTPPSSPGAHYRSPSKAGGPYPSTSRVCLHVDGPAWLTGDWSLLPGIVATTSPVLSNLIEVLPWFDPSSLLFCHMQVAHFGKEKNV